MAGTPMKMSTTPALERYECDVLVRRLRQVGATKPIENWLSLGPPPTPDAVKIGRDGDRQFYRRPVRQLCQFQFGHDVLLAARRRQNEVLVHNQPDGCAGLDRDRRLNIETA
jgi:hypothetical protein